MSDTTQAIAALAMEGYQRGSKDALLTLAEMFDQLGMTDAATITRSALAMVTDPIDPQR